MSMISYAYFYGSVVGMSTKYIDYLVNIAVIWGSLKIIQAASQVFRFIYR